MTASHDLERRIADFYATEPPLRAPDRVLENALTSIESTQQRRVMVHVPWRLRPMNSYAKLAVAAVAIVAVGFAAWTLLPPNDSVGPPTPAPTATSLPSPAPSASQAAALPLPAGDRLLDPGRYSVAVPGTEVRVTFTVADGDWRGNEWYLSSPNGSISFWAVANVYPDACEESLDRLPDPPIGPTVADLVEALDAQASTDLQRIATPSVGGHASAEIVMEPSGSLGQRCVNGQNMQLWVGPGDAVGRAIDIQEPLGGRQDVMWIIDAGGSRIVVVAYHDRTEPEAGAINALIGSIGFELP